MDLNIRQSTTQKVTIKNATPVISLTLSQVGSKVRKYTGEYDVTPTIEGSVLPTADKLMEKDVNIKAIPFYEVSNDTGETVYIAKEIK